MSSSLRTSEVANAAVAAFAAPAHPDPWPLRVQLSALHRTTTLPLDADLAGWADGLAELDGTFPLLGTGRRADTYPALLWCGARLARAGADADVGVLLAGLAAGSQAGSNAEDLGRAVRAAAAASRVVATLAWRGPTIARPTTAVLAAATAAALLTGVRSDELVRVLDTAASLMVLTPGTDVADASSLSPLWLGHASAAGWLASVLPGLGVTAMPGALAHTLDVAAGSTPVHPPWEGLLDTPLDRVRVGQLLEVLGERSDVGAHQ